MRTTLGNGVQARRGTNLLGNCASKAYAPVGVRTPQHHGSALKNTLGSRKRVLASSIELASAGVVHIDETTLIAGSTGLALAVPAVIEVLRSRRVTKISPAQALAMLKEPDSKYELVDVRMQGSINIQGLPILDTARAVVAAPFMELKLGRLQRDRFFEETLLLASGVGREDPLIFIDWNDEHAYQAATAVAALGGTRKLYVIKGGFKAWQEAKLPWCDSPLRAAKQGKATPARCGDDEGCAPVQAPAMPHTKREPIFKPKLLEVLAEGYGLDDLKQDVQAGLVVGVIALSLSMALGIASEATPAAGIYTAVTAGFLISAIGGSRVCIGGPTAAFIPIVVGVAHKYGPENLILCTVLAGAILIAMGLTGLGNVIRYIPRPVVSGFTAGIGAYIFSTQIKDFLGLGVPGHLPAGVPVPPEFIEKVVYLGSHLGSSHLPSLGLAAACLGMLLTWPKPWGRVIAPQMVAVVGGTLLSTALTLGLGMDTGIETIGSHYGWDAIPTGLPMPSLPMPSSFEQVQNLLYPAFTIALLAAIESLLCARVSDKIIGDKHDSNTELIAQGAANVVSAAFGGLPATGALARTAANVRSGGRSPVSGMVHAAVVLAIIMGAGPLAAYIPLPALSAVLVVVAMNMGEWENFKELPTWRRSDEWLFLIAFFLTLFCDVAVAVEFGMVAAVLLFVKDVTGAVRVDVASSIKTPEMTLTFCKGALPPRTLQLSTGLDVPKGVSCVSVTGALLFGGGDKLERAMEEKAGKEGISVVVLDMTNVTVMDNSGLEVIENQWKNLRAAKKTLLLCGLGRQPLRNIMRSGFMEHLGHDHLFRNSKEALNYAGMLAAMTTIDTEAEEDGEGKGPKEVEEKDLREDVEAKEPQHA